MPTEAWAIDGLVLTSGTFSLMELNADPPRERRDWITAADSESAELFRQPLHENRTISMKVRVLPQASMDAALDQVAALVTKLRKASQSSTGVALTWTPKDSARTATFTVLAGEVTGLPISLDGDGYSWILNRPIVTVEFTCRPYWVGSETLTGSTSSSTPFTAIEVASVTGDITALGRLIVTDNASQSRRHVEWGLEGPLTYNNATSLLVDSDDMVTTGFSGAQATTTGAYDPNASGNNSISFTLVAGTTTALAGTGNLSHVGVFRVKARVQSGSLSNQFRLSWKALDGPMNSNDWVSPVSASGWQELDLGTVTVPAATVGSQRWTGQVEVAAAASSPGAAVLDYLILIPLADGYGKARASWSYSAGVLSAYDDFSGGAGSLNTRAAAVGGSWATSGDTTDFSFSSAPMGSGSPASVFARSTTNGTAVTGRFAVLGTTNYTDMQVDVTAYLNGGGSFTGSITQGVIARWTDANNHLRAQIEVTAASGYSAVLRLRQLVAGVATDQTSASFTIPGVTSGSTPNVVATTIRVIAFSSGRVIGLVYNLSGSLLAQAEMSTSALATGGTLASGKPGFYDLTGSTTILPRYYDSFSSATVQSEPIAIYSGRNMQVRYDDTLRQDSTGTYTGRPSSYRGSRFLLPVGTSRVLVKARRNDIDTALDDQVTDSTTVQVGWTPRGLVVPR